MLRSTSCTNSSRIRTACGSPRRAAVRVRAATRSESSWPGRPSRSTLPLPVRRPRPRPLSAGDGVEVAEGPPWFGSTPGDLFSFRARPVKTATVAGTLIGRRPQRTRNGGHRHTRQRRPQQTHQGRHRVQKISDVRLDGRGHSRLIRTSQRQSGSEHRPTIARSSPPLRTRQATRLAATHTVRASAGRQRRSST